METTDGGISFRSYRDACVAVSEGKKVDPKLLTWLEREEQVIRASMFRPKSFVDRGLYEAYFTGEDYKIAWRAITEISKTIESDGQIQPITVLSEMRKHDHSFHGKSGLAWISGLMGHYGADWQYALSSIVPEIICRNKNDIYLKRMDYLKERVSNAEPTEVHSEIIAESRRVANDTSSLRLGRPSIEIKWSAPDEEDDSYREMIVPTGVPQIDDNSGGHRRGELMVVGGGTNTGKSYFAEMLSNNSALARRRCLYISIEDSEELMHCRMVSRYSEPRIRPLDINVKKANPQSVKEAMRKMAEAHGDRAYILELKKATLSQLCAAIQHNRYALGIDMVIVDYLQAVRPDTASGNRTQEISEIVAQLKKCASQYDVALVVVSQLSREEYKDGNEPSINSCKYAGDIENEAEIMVLMWRDEADVLHAKIAKLKWSQSRDLRFIIKTDFVCGAFGEWVDDLLPPKEKKEKQIRRVQ